MTIQCGSCGVKLRVPAHLEGKKTSAKCPRCKNQIPITGAGSMPATGAERPTVRVECNSCGAKLKAPAPSTETTSRCPKCQGSITIPAAGTPATPTPSQSGPEPATMAARSDSETPSEESGVATRRIDSRTLGMMGMGSAPGAASEMDLDDLVRKPPTPPMATDPGEAGQSEGAKDIATALMNPPVEGLKKAAETIREGSEEISSESTTDQPAHQDPASPAQTLPKPPVAQARTPTPLNQVPRRTARRSFPVFRGLLAGGLAGAVFGAAWMGLELSPVQTTLEGFTATLPALVTDSLTLSAPVVRLLFLAVLGSLVGFLCGAIGASGDTDALNAIRCALVGALAGAALGMSGGIDPTSGFRIWPVAHWVRDLMLVGLLTPALNRIIPGR